MLVTSTEYNSDDGHYTGILYIPAVFRYLVIDPISTTEVRVNVVVDGRHGEKGRAALLREFKDAMG